MIPFMTLNTPEIPDPLQNFSILVLNKMVWFLDGSRGSDFERSELSTNITKFWSGSGSCGVFSVIKGMISRKVFLTKNIHIEKPSNVKSHKYSIFPDRIRNGGHHKTVY